MVDENENDGLTPEQKALAEKNLKPKENDNNDKGKKKQDKNDDNNNQTADDLLKISKEIEEEKKELAKERKELESMRDLQEQRGRAPAGQSQKSEDERQIDEARKLVAGTGLDPFN